MPDVHKYFQELGATFTTWWFLVHFDVKPLIKLETDALGYAIFGILFQKLETV